MHKNSKSLSGFLSVLSFATWVFLGLENNRIVASDYSLIIIGKYETISKLENTNLRLNLLHVSTFLIRHTIWGLNRKLFNRQFKDRKWTRNYIFLDLFQVLSIYVLISTWLIINSTRIVSLKILLLNKKNIYRK